MSKYLVTGAAGFIGAEVCLALLARGDDVVGIDNLNDYYDVGLKQARVERINSETEPARSSGKPGTFHFVKADLALSISSVNAPPYDVLAIATC